jgi:hypothetical protein
LENRSVSIRHTTSSDQSTQNGSGRADTSFCVDPEHHVMAPIDTEGFGLPGDGEAYVSVWFGDRVENDMFVVEAEPGKIEGEMVLIWQFEADLVDLRDAIENRLRHQPSLVLNRS